MGEAREEQSEGWVAVGAGEAILGWGAQLCANLLILCALPRRACAWFNRSGQICPLTSSGRTVVSDRRQRKKEFAPVDRDALLEAI